MIVFKTAIDLRYYLSANIEGKSIGFVPTMGALHSGHISLIKQALDEKQLTVCSIFVNPTQFNDPKDFEKYPITIEKDIELLENAGCDILFLPAVSEMYPNGTSPLQPYELGFLELVLDGKFRPGHFQGVCNVVHRLLNAVPCQKLYLGQKDYQQCMVIQKLIEITGKNVQLVICPTKREPNGLAMSSRNMRLSEDQKVQAGCIYQALEFIKANINSGSLVEVKKEAETIINKQHLKIDYFEIADAKSLELINEWDGQRNLVGLIAAFCGDVRLIDNMPLN